MDLSAGQGDKKKKTVGQTHTQKVITRTVLTLTLAWMGWNGD